MASTVKTTLTQTCTSYEDNAGATRFRIESVVGPVLAGDLPHADIFLHEVEVASDPKSDVFLRIVTLTDLTSVTRGRAAALAAGKNTYLSSGFVIEYTDLATAVQGKAVIQARVDALITDWRTYQEKYANPSSFFLPLSASSVVKAAKAAYVAAIKDRDSRETIFDNLRAQYDIDVAAAAAAATKVAEAQSRSDALTQLTSQFTAAFAGLSTYRANVDSFVAAAQTFQAVADVFEQSHTDTNFRTEVDVFGGAATAMVGASMSELTSVKSPLEAFSTQLTAQATTLVAELVAARSAKTAADAAAATTQTKLTLAESALDAAQAAADAALVTVKNYVPTFNPDTDL